MALPSIEMEPGDWSWYRRDWIRRSPLQSSVRAIRIEICPEIEQLVLQVRRRPEQRAIQILASNRADQPFHKGMGQGNIGDGFDFDYLQDPQIGLPLPKPIQGIMVGAEVVGHTGLPSNGAVEHAAKCHAIDGSGVDAEPNDPAGVLIHDDQDPAGPQRGRFAPEQIYTPEAVLHVANEGQPGWTTGVLFRPIVAGENPSNDVFVDGDVESQGNLLSDSRAAPGGIALLHLDNSVDEFFVGSVWSRAYAGAWMKKSRQYFRFLRARWRPKRVEGFSTIAERIRRAGRMRRAHRPGDGGDLKCVDWGIAIAND